MLVGCCIYIKDLGHDKILLLVSAVCHDSESCVDVAK